MLKTGEQHRQSLRDGRQVFIDGSAVSDVTEHPAFKRSIGSSCGLYDYHSAEANRERMTFCVAPSDERANRMWQLPTTYEELKTRRQALEAWAELMRDARALAGSRRVVHLRHVHGARPLRGHDPARAARCATTTGTRATTISISPTSSSTRRPTAPRAPASSRTSSWSPASCDEDRRASRSAARRCSATGGRHGERSVRRRASSR